ncbi:MAG: BrnT family toxin [Haliea sp.]|uniref:BrnT family toxin n=1 Tax=Haliea sp. TaxID=1932666 RepID=UPI0032ED601D
MRYNFEWDPVKARSNAEKHCVSFEQATEVFKDPMALTLYDDDNASSEEDRWITLGQANGQHYLVVAHTYRNQQDNAVTIRLISARPATKREIKQYEG